MVNSARKPSTSTLAFYWFFDKAFCETRLDSLSALTDDSREEILRYKFAFWFSSCEFCLRSISCYSFNLLISSIRSTNSFAYFLPSPFNQFIDSLDSCISVIKRATSDLRTASVSRSYSTRFFFVSASSSLIWIRSRPSSILWMYGSSRICLMVVTISSLYCYSCNMLSSFMDSISPRITSFRQDFCTVLLQDSLSIS